MFKICEGVDDARRQADDLHEFILEKEKQTKAKI